MFGDVFFDRIPGKDTQEIRASMSASPATVNTATGGHLALPSPAPSATPTSRPPSSSPPSSAKGVDADLAQAKGPESVGAKDSDPISTSDRTLLKQALAKINELENRLQGKDPEENKPQEDDEDPIITPDGQKVSYLKWANV